MTYISKSNDRRGIGEGIRILLLLKITHVNSTGMELCESRLRLVANLLQNTTNKNKKYNQHAEKEKMESYEMVN